MIKTYARVDQGSVIKFPYTRANFRGEYPNVSIPSDPTAADLATFGVVEVALLPPPAHDPLTQNVIEMPPTFNGTAWERAWAVTPATVEEQTGRQKGADLDATIAMARADAMIQFIETHTLAEIAQWVDDNVKSLDDAKGLFKKLAILAAVQVKGGL